MKYIIWGAGKRGKWASLFLGSQNILAFIDADEQRVGQIYCGKKIISFKEIGGFPDCLIVVTPLNGSEAIEKYLVEHNFYKYVKLDDLPMYMPCDEQDEFSIIPSYERDKSYGLIGVNIFTIYLYQKMKETQTKVEIALYGNLHADLIDFLGNYIEFSTIDNVEKNADEIIVLNEKIQKLLRVESITADKFTIERLLPMNHELLEYKNIHKGKRCFIVATGPSLSINDLNRLHEHGEICISMNRIFNIFPRTQWRPNYYMIGDKEMIEDLSDQIADLRLPHKFVSSEPKSYWKNSKSKDSIPYKILTRGYIDKMPFFSENIEKGICHGTTVTYVCIQLAVYMGFSEIFLLGVDFNYSNDLYDTKNHFEGCDTIDNKIRLNRIYPERVLLAYKKAYEYCQNHDCNIYNATRGGKLELYKRVNFDELF